MKEIIKENQSGEINTGTLGGDKPTLDTNCGSCRNLLTSDCAGRPKSEGLTILDCPRRLPIEGVGLYH